MPRILWLVQLLVIVGWLVKIIILGVFYKRERPLLTYCIEARSPLVGAVYLAVTPIKRRRGRMTLLSKPRIKTAIG